MPTEANNSELFSQIDCVTPSIHLVFCAANTIVRVFLFHFLGPIIAVQYVVHSQRGFRGTQPMEAGKLR